jgi:hypothetical protein
MEKTNFDSPISVAAKFEWLFRNFQCGAPEKANSRRKSVSLTSRGMRAWPASI